MNTNTIKVRMVSILIIAAAIVAAYFVAMNLRPGSTAGATEQAPCIGFCNIDSGSAGTPGSPDTTTGGGSGGVGGSATFTD